MDCCGEVNLAESAEVLKLVNQKSPPLNEPPPMGAVWNRRRALNCSGAGDGTRTRACELGKLVPYHLATPAQDLILAQSQQEMPVSKSCIYLKCKAAGGFGALIESVHSLLLR